MKKIFHLAAFVLALIRTEMAWGQNVNCHLVRREIDNLCNGSPQITQATSSEDNSTEILLQKIDALSDQQQALLQSTASTISALGNQLNTLQQRLDMLHQLGSTPVHPASSCAEVLEEYPDSSSGYYWVRNPLGQTHRVYCDMTRSCGGVTGGWMRVAYLDMTNSSHRCPSSLNQHINYGVRSCAVQSNSGSCSSVWYRPQGIIYSRVCGKVLGYFDKSTDGFNKHNRPTSPSINSNYVDGVSLTYGKTYRRHIWTFVSTNVRNHNPYYCYCGDPPPYVNSHYFCDAQQLYARNVVHNPLWDGEGCGSRSCCHLHNPPWFYRHLPRTTTEDIEMRVCRDQDRSDEDVKIGVVEIYVR